MTGIISYGMWESLSPIHAVWPRSWSLFHSGQPELIAGPAVLLTRYDSSTLLLDSTSYDPSTIFTTNSIQDEHSSPEHTA